MPKGVAAVNDIPEDLLDAPGRLLTLEHAAGYLGIGRSTVMMLVRKFNLPTVRLGTHTLRFLLSDLDTWLTERRGGSMAVAMDPEASSLPDELPTRIIARLVGTKRQSVLEQKRNGYLKGYTPEDVREYILRKEKKRLAAQVRREHGLLVSRYAGKVCELEAKLKDIREKYVALGGEWDGRLAYNRANPIAVKRWGKKDSNVSI